MNQNKKHVNIPVCYGKAELTGISRETNYSSYSSQANLLLQFISVSSHPVQMHEN